MIDTSNQSFKNQFQKNGYFCIAEVYTLAEVQRLIDILDAADTSNDTFRKSKDLFAVRQVLKEIPKVSSVVFNTNLMQIINDFFGSKFFVTKSIYFNKPGASNWFVAYHQDLTISVDKKVESAGFGPWTVKQNQFAVQPPVDILENNFTIRIHLDNTDGDNGALKVLPGSHQLGICRIETIQLDRENQVTCAVPKGGIMLMRPLLFHASDRTVNNNQRRVIHIEFSDYQLPSGLNWSEKQSLN